MYEFLAQDWVIEVCANLFYLFVSYHLFIVILWYFKQSLYLKLWYKNDEAQAFFVLSGIAFFFYWLLYFCVVVINPEGPKIAAWPILIWIVVCIIVYTIKILSHLRKKIPGEF